MASKDTISIPEPAIFLSASVPIEGLGNYIETASSALMKKSLLVKKC
jgi:hypothetical protein